MGQVQRTRRGVLVLVIAVGVLVAATSKAREAHGVAAPQLPGPPVVLSLDASASQAGGTWARLLGGSGDDVLTFGRANPDGSVDLLGTLAEGSAAKRGWIVRLDAAGVPLAQKQVGSDTMRVEEIAPAGDGGFLVRATALLPFNTTQSVVAKLDSGFALMWQKTVGDTLAKYDDLVPLPDGGALLTGQVFSSQTFSSSQMVTRLDAAGNLMWRRDVAPPASFALAAFALPDGGFALVGTLRDLTGNFDAWVCRLDGNGNRLWDRRLSVGGSETGLSVAALPGGALVVSALADLTGTGKADVLLVRLDTAGAVTAHRVLGGDLWESGLAIVGIDGKPYLVGGTMSFGQGAWDGWLSELDPATLQPLWSRTIGTPADDFVGFAPDSVGGGFFGTGTTKVAGGRLDIFVGKLGAGADAFAWQRLLGGAAEEAGGGVRLPDGTIVVTGASDSFAPASAPAGASLSVLPGAAQDDALVARLDADGGLPGCVLATAPAFVVAPFTPSVTAPALTATTLAPQVTSVAETTGAATIPVADFAPPPREACSATAALAAQAAGSPTSGAAPLAVGFTGSATGGQPPYSYAWSFGDGSPASALQSPAHTYLAAGSFTASLTVTDAAAATASSSVVVTVGEPECTLQCLVEVNPTGAAGTTFLFDGGYRATSCGGSPAYLWSFGDGTTATTQDVSHTYAAPGTYPWSFTVMLDGKQCSSSGSVTVAGVQDVAVLVGGAALSDGQAAAVPFGSVGQGQPGSTRTFTVRNDGVANLTVGAVTVPAGFTVTEPLVGPLQPGASDTFTVRLDSAVLGAKSGQLVINTNDPDEQPFNVPIAGAVVSPSSLPRRFDFGTTGSPVAATYLRASEATAYGAAQGYGWTSGVVVSRDRGAGGDLGRDFVFSPLATFEVDVAYGVWDVTVTIGDANAAHDRMGVLLEGVGVDELTTRAGELLTRSYRVAVADGRLSLGLDDLGGTDPNVVLAALVLAPPIAEGKFDFGTATSPVAPGYTRVEPASAYASATGFGWISGTRDARDRGTGGDLNRDFVFTPLATFAVDVPPGAWDVTVTLGDMNAAHDQMGVFIEGEPVWQVSLSPGLGAFATFRVHVLDGQLTVLLDDLGGSDPNVTLCALTVAPAPAVRLDFGTASSPVGWGHTRATQATAYSPQQGFGWLSGTRVARDRGTGTELTRDFVYSPLAELAVDLPAGRYDVTVTMGDATAAHEQMGLLLEGSQVDSVTTAANQFVTRTYRVAVADGQLRVKLDDLGGADPNVVINSLSVVPAAILKLDFGTSTSPVAPDYLRVTETTAYAAVPGYGWLSGARVARDRATADPLTRDFAFSALATFAVDVPRGSHLVTVRLGDATAAHEQMGVHFEGNLFESVTAAVGQFVTRATQVDVQDGQLTVLLDDLGGTDPNVVINALEIR